jgi:hypothetical protein
VSDSPSSFTFANLSVEEARTQPSESGYGVTLDGWSAFFPGMPCYTCGKFVGRDGHFEIEHFEMSSTIASIEAECARCRG